MNKLLAAASLVALVTACAPAPRQPSSDTAAMGAGAQQAADLGYHGPARRAPPPLYGN
jgi:opacity protein-like surface antigen